MNNHCLCGATIPGYFRLLCDDCRDEMCQRELDELREIVGVIRAGPRLEGTRDRLVMTGQMAIDALGIPPDDCSPNDVRDAIARLMNPEVES